MRYIGSQNGGKRESVLQRPQGYSQGMAETPVKRYSSDPSERARQLLAEGKIGPSYGKLGGRPKVPRATDVAAQEIRRHGKLIAKAIVEGLKSDSHHVRLKAVDAALKLDKTLAEEQREEAKAEAEAMDREALIRVLADKLGGDSQQARLLKLEMERRTVDGEAVEVPANGSQ